MALKIKKVDDALYLREDISSMRMGRSILLVEDDQVDAMTIKRAFKDVNIKNRLDIVCDGEEALKYLNNKEIEDPGIVLLDLNMPKMNGIEFLKIVKKDMSLKRIPIIVMSTSDNEEDKTECFSLSVAGYMIKPIDYKIFVEMIKTINTYWTMSELPES